MVKSWFELVCNVRFPGGLIWLILYLIVILIVIIYLNEDIICNSSHWVIFDNFDAINEVIFEAFPYLRPHEVDL